MIVIENLYKSYESRRERIDVLKNVNLSINDGEIFGIIGKSGEGKSTLIRTINSLEKPSRGTIKVNNINLNELNTSQLRAAQRQIGMIFQHFNLLKTQTVLNNILLPLKIAGSKPEEYKEWIDQLLTITGLHSKINAYPSQLSGGEKQRVSIARALIAKPSILLSDEATSSLDPETTRQILKLLITIRNTYKITIVLITHEMEVIKQICDRVAVLHGGEIAEVAQVKQFLKSPQSLIGKRFLIDYQINHDEPLSTVVNDVNTAP